MLFSLRDIGALYYYVSVFESHALDSEDVAINSRVLTQSCLHWTHYSALKHGVRSGICTISEMSDGEDTGTQPPAPQISQQISTPATRQEPDNMASAIPTLPSGLKPRPTGNALNEPGITTRLWQGWSDSMKNSKRQCSCR